MSAILNSFINLIFIVLLLADKAIKGYNQELQKLSKFYINLLIYYDNDLLIKFNNNVDLVHQYILTIVNSVSLNFQDSPIKDVADVILIVQSIKKLPSSITIDSNRDGNIYRQKFGQYVEANENNLYAAAILITNYNFLYNSDKTDAQGLSRLGAICNEMSDRAIIVQSRSYRGAFVLAHELGHSFGLEHDEKMGCGSNFIMSMSTGPGKTRFSRCNTEQLRKELKKKLQKHPFAADCFRYMPPDPVAIFPDNTINSPTPTEQCRIQLGSTFEAIPLSNSLFNICTHIGCQNDLIHIDIHPALENTSCGYGKYCRNGRCA